MDALVTGGTGFVGAHVVRALLARGRSVRCLTRPSSPRVNLEGLPVEIVTGDLLEPDSLRRSVRGTRELYHCAADYRLYAADPGEIYAANVDGTRHLMRAALEEGVDRVVYTSSVAALGLQEDGSPGDETTPVYLDRVIGHYKRSKFLAEKVVQGFVAKGLPAVIVNPSTPVGELDVKPTPTGRIIVDFLQGRMKAYVETGLNLVDVEDVAKGHLLAAERGRIGQKYILGNRNLKLKDLFDILSRITDIPSPQVRLPHWIPYAFAVLDTTWARLRNRIPTVSVESVKMSRHLMFFRAERAVRELGLPQTPVEEALERAVDWFRRTLPGMPARRPRRVGQLSPT